MNWAVIKDLNALKETYDALMNCSFHNLFKGVYGNINKRICRGNHGFIKSLDLSWKIELFSLLLSCAQKKQTSNLCNLFCFLDHVGPFGKMKGYMTQNAMVCTLDLHFLIFSMIGFVGEWHDKI